MLTKRLILVKRFFLHVLDSSWRGEGGQEAEIRGQRVEERLRISDLTKNRHQVENNEALDAEHWASKDENAEVGRFLSVVRGPLQTRHRA
jgi:hypothetical protein